MKKKDEYQIEWSIEKINDFRRTLLNWYDQEKRDVPWRRHRENPYYIWISEIMLQQTQVATVIPYYNRFVETLPTIHDLATADEATLMALWQGLGYYSRVRNMQVAARQVMNDYDGEMPRTYEELLTLKGIGPYTAAAIASIAYNLPEPALDGNLMRIVTRLFAIDDDITKVKSQRKFREIYRQLIDPERPGDFNQALMDMGATIMTPSNPYPDPHPLLEFDKAYALGIAHQLPNKPNKVKQTEHQIYAYIVQNQEGAYLMRQHQAGELNASLWHFPLQEQFTIGESTKADYATAFLTWVDEYLLTDVNITSLTQTDFPVVKHVFSHRIWQVERVLLVTEHFPLPEGMAWVTPKQLDNYPMSTLQQKLFAGLKR